MYLGYLDQRSRDLIKTISKDNFDNNNFQFGTAKYITVDEIRIWAQRLSYVGELGYELYVKKLAMQKKYMNY